MAEITHADLDPLGNALASLHGAILDGDRIAAKKALADAQDRFGAIRRIVDGIEAECLTP